MREYSFQINFDSGLRPYAEWKRGAKGMIECFNLVPRRGRLEPYENITEPFATTMNWPFPQLALGSDHWYLLGGNFIQEINSDWTLGSTVDTMTGGRWNFLDFGMYQIFTNGVDTFLRSPSTGLVSYHNSSVVPYAKTMCNFKGQIVAGNVYGHDSNVVVWGSIGYTNLKQSVDPVVAGHRKVPWAGDIVCVKRLGDQIVVYTENGIGYMSPAYVDPTPAFRFDEVRSVGVVAVGGSIQSQLALDTSGKLWRIIPGAVPKELGYQEFFSPMLGDDIVIAHDAHRDEFYIGNGTLSYLLTPEGLCQIHERVSDCEFFGGGLIGLTSSGGPLSSYVTPNVFDMDLGGRKTLESVDIACEGSGWIATAYGTDRRGHFAYERSSPVNLEGMASPKMTASEFKVQVKNPSYLAGGLDYMNIHYKLVDKRFKRSPYARQATPGSDQ